MKQPTLFDSRNPSFDYCSRCGEKIKTSEGVKYVPVNGKMVALHVLPCKALQAPRSRQSTHK